MSDFKIQTYTGLMLDLLEPKPEQICIEDICHHLSHDCRFEGATRLFYSVAQHSCYVCGYAPEHLKLEGLLDDAEETYTRDIPKPFKLAMISITRDKYVKRYGIKRPRQVVYSPFDIITTRIKRAIRLKFDLKISRSDKRVLKRIDNRIALTEERDLMNSRKMIRKGLQPYDIRIIPWSFAETREKFVGFYDLYRRDKDV